MSQTIVAIDARLIAGTGTGDSTYWTGLLYGFSKLQLPFHILLFTDKPRPANVPDVEGIEWVFLPSSNSRIWSLAKFPLAARKRGAKVFHTQYSMSPLVGDRGVTTIHDVSFFIGPEWFQPQDRVILQRTVPAAAKRAAKIITVSDTSRREIEQYIPLAKRKVVVIPNACPPWIEFVDRHRAREIIAREFGIESPYVFTLGTQWPRKNMQLAVDAVNLLPRDLLHQLLVTGKAGTDHVRLGQRSRALGYVDERLLGALYAGADLYLAPSRHEGFGIPVLEAYRCGCPVLSSSGGALPEIAALAGLVEPTWTADHWAKTIEALLRAPSTLQNMRDRGIEQEKRFTWEIAARKTLAVYDEVAR